MWSDVAPRSRWLAVMPLFGASAVLFWLSSIPDLSTPDLGFSWQDKIYHFVAYFVYGTSAQIAVVVWSSASTSMRIQAVAVVLIGGLYGISDELHQTVVPGRDGSIADLIADVVGVAASTILLPAARRVLRRRQ